MSLTNEIDLNKHDIVENIQIGNKYKATLIENKETKVQYLQISESSYDDNLMQLSNNPSFLKIIELTNNKTPANIIYEYPKKGALIKLIDQENSNTTVDPLTPTQKFIIIYGIAIGIQHLHINNLYHGNLNLSTVFLDENLYPHIYLPYHSNDELSFETRNINEINDITSFGFMVYELFLGKKIFDENQKLDEKLVNFDLSILNNKWQKSFLKKFFPRASEYLNINNIINDLITNKEEFGIIDNNDLSLYFDIIKNYQIQYSNKMQNEAEKYFIKPMLVYARMLNYGYCVEADKKRSAYFLKRASVSGNVDAIYEYGMMLNNGDGIILNQEKAIIYLKEAANKNHSGAMFEYGCILLDKNPKCSQGSELIKKAADQGYIKAQYKFAINHDESLDAIKYYKNSADLGYVEAMNNLALIYKKLDQENHKDCIQMYLKYMKMAISLDFPISMYNLGVNLINENKIPKDIEEGLKYLKESADLGYINAIKVYSQMLLKGENIEENKEEAAKYIKIGADKGDLDLINSYGVLLLNGVGVEKDIEEAKRYFQLGFFDINSKNSLSMFNYGITLMQNNQEKEGLHYIHESLNYGCLNALPFIFVHPDDEQTKTQEELNQEYKNLADEGNADAMFEYALILYNGEGIPENKIEAAKYYHMAAKKGHIIAMNNYALMLLKGDGIEQNKSKAAKYFKMAADKGHDVSNFFYGIMLYNGDGIPSNKNDAIPYVRRAKDENITAAIELYKDMVEKGEIIKEEKPKVSLKLRQMIYEGDENAMFTYAIMLLKGDGIFKSRKAAAKYLKMAAEKGHLASMFRYALMLQTGNGIPVDKNEAAKYLRIAADRGHCLSMHYYAMALKEGNGVQKNMKEAAKYYRIAASQGNNVSANNYGIMLYNGEGVKQNKEEGLKYLKKASENGDDIEKLNYGLLKNLESETSSEKNESIKFIKMSADEGNNDARLIYGNYLYKGNGVPKDKKEAAKYYKLAADDGSIDSMYKYAEMVEKGDGIPINIEEAIEYYQRALLRNDPKASSKLNDLQVYFTCCL